MMASAEVAAGVWTPEDRASAPFREIPVEVPPGARALRVELVTDETRGVLDLGLLDASGFRGWSGGARNRFTLLPGAATPGYLPGPLEPGTWKVLVGLHRVAPEGVPYAVHVSFEPGPLDAREPGPARPAQRRSRSIEGGEGRRWWPGDLHAHTEHSDGELSVVELGHLAGSQGLAFLAVTDHNTISHHGELSAASRATGVVLLEGQEVTTDTGHANAIGTPRWVDFREPVDVWRIATLERGGVLTVNHPLAGDCAWGFADPPPGSLIEAWHGPTAFLTDQALAWARGRDGVPIGGSDYHRASDPMLPGQPTTWLEADEPTPAGYLDALRARRVAISRDASGPAMVRRGDDLVVVGGDGTMVQDPSGRQEAVRGDLVIFADASPEPHRLVSDRHGLLAVA